MHPSVEKMVYGFVSPCHSCDERKLNCKETCEKYKKEKVFADSLMSYESYVSDKIAKHTRKMIREKRR